MYQITPNFTIVFLFISTLQIILYIQATAFYTLYTKTKLIILKRGTKYWIFLIFVKYFSHLLKKCLFCDTISLQSKLVVLQLACIKRQFNSQSDSEKSWQSANLCHGMAPANKLTWLESETFIDQSFEKRVVSTVLWIKGF